MRNKFYRISLGYNFKDKLLSVGIEFLKLIPYQFRVQNHLEKLLSKLYQNLTVALDGVKYTFIDLPSFNIICGTDFEAFISLWFNLEKNEVFMDVGAHIGKYTLFAANIVGNSGKVIAVEPHPRNCRILEHNVSINGFHNITILNVACWSKKTELKMFIGSESGHHSLKLNRKLGAVMIEAVPIDRIMAEMHINRLDWIKIDVEAAEYEVLQGLKKTLRTCRPKIIIEVFKFNVNKIKKFMRNHNYGLIKISPYNRNVTYFFCLPL